MPFPKIVPALADLTQDIAGPLPVELLHAWAAGTQDVGEAERLLDPYRIAGTVVASDTSGLTRMTEERDLLDVLALVSQPKQVVHDLGVAIGGRPIGIWVADNTEMYYPSGVEPGQIVDAMAEAQAQIGSRLPIGVGMCAHCGEFFEIGGGLYGDEAETVERLAEEFAGPGEMLLTRAAIDRLDPPEQSSFTPRLDLASEHAPGVYTLACPRRRPDLIGAGRPYPHPYPDDFFALLLRLGDAGDADRIRRQIYETYLRDRAVVFVSHAHPRTQAGSLQTLLDDLVNNALVETIVRVAMGAGDHVAGLGGGLAVLTFDTAADALDFARQARDRFAENGIAVKLGVDRGEVLYFRNPRGPSGIAGDAVNVASKLSEDCETAGRIRITDRACRGIAHLPGARPFNLVISHVTLTGVEL